MDVENLLIMFAGAVWYALPAVTANQLPIFAKYFNILPSLARPIDGGRLYRDGKPLFGKNKTYRGFIVACIGGIIVAIIQWKLLLIFPWLRRIHVVNIKEEYVPLFGFLAGFGAMTGDLIKSFFKRRAGVDPGKPWMPFDQIDAAIGFLVFTSPLFVPPVTLVVVLIMVTIPLHIMTNLAGYYLGFKPSKL